MMMMGADYRIYIYRIDGESSVWTPDNENRLISQPCPSFYLWFCIPYRSAFGESAMANRFP